VTKIEEGDLDEKLFEVPEDYTEMPMGGAASATGGEE